MNATGTERQRAVIAAYRMAPTALQAEIARAAGVSASYVATVLGDYLESKAREQASQMPTCTASNPTEHDVADFAPDRRIGGNCGPDACAVKWQHRAGAAFHKLARRVRKIPNHGDGLLATSPVPG